jgi:hypothetical protein
MQLFTPCRIIVAALLTLTLCSCENRGSSATDYQEKAIETEQEKAFREIVEGFPELKLPIEVDDSGRASLAYGSLLSDKAKSFVDEFNRRNKSDVHFWGRVYPSDKFHYLIGSMPADVVIPIIYVFDKTGKTVDRESVVSEFGVGPEGYGKSAGLIRADKSFSEIDSLFYHTYIEESDSIVPGSGICTAAVSEFRIREDGQIEMERSDTVRSKIPD